MENIKDTEIVNDIEKIIDDYKDNGSRAIAKVIYKHISEYGNCSKCNYFELLKENKQLKKINEKAVKYAEENLNYIDNAIQQEELLSILKGSDSND